MSQHVLRIDKNLISVDKEIYEAYYKMKRREKYLVESDQAHGVVSYDALGLNMEILVQPGDSPEDKVMDKMTREKLRVGLMYLEPDERKLIFELFYNEKSERQYAKELGVYQNAVHKKKQRILKKLMKILSE